MEFHLSPIIYWHPRRMRKDIIQFKEEDEEEENYDVGDFIDDEAECAETDTETETDGKKGDGCRA